MKDLADLLHPLTPERFFAEYHGRRPLHLPASDAAGVPGLDRASLLDWEGLSQLLNQSSIWTPSTLKLVQNTEPIPPELYCRLVRDQNGEQMRPDPAKVSLFLARGASLIAGDVQGLTPALSRLTQALGRAFAASAQANVYCSFQGVKAFGSHYDLTDVFAIQTRGTKLWKLYAHREDLPVEMPELPDPRAYFEQARGPVVAEIMMRPGDVLYIPRGCYHDALAQDEASLHVTIALAPLHGRVLFRLLEHAAMQDRAFRAYLPPADQDGGHALQAHLADLGQRLAQLAAHPAFRDEVAMAQEQIIPREAAITLPRAPALTTYRRTSLVARTYSGPLAHAMNWALSQPGFVLEEVIAQFNFVPEADIRQAVEEAEKAGVLQRV